MKSEEGSSPLNPPCESDFPTNPSCNYPKYPDKSIPGGEPAPAPEPLPPQDCTCGSSFVMETASTMMGSFELSDMPDTTVVSNDAFQ